MQYRILVKTQDYLEAFSRFEDKDSLEVVEQRLKQRVQLESFERSQLGACATEGDRRGVGSLSVSVSPNIFIII